MRTVGVIGGMGPAATVQFMSRVMDATKAQTDAEHVPLLVDQNPQVPSRIAALVEDGSVDPTPVIIAMAQRLERAGSEALVMPCNTAHHYAGEIRDAVSIPLISMVDLVVAAAEAHAPGRSIGLLGSPALAKVGVFEKPFAARGLSTVPLNNPEATLSAIQSIKAQGVTPSAITIVNDEAANMVALGARAICVSCTEFSLVADKISATVPVFDALDLLVAATVRFSQEGVLPKTPAAQSAKNTEIQYSNREKETT